jgi:hypothetical protein
LRQHTPGRRHLDLRQLQRSSVFQGSELRLPTSAELASAMRDQNLPHAIKDVQAALYGVDISSAAR